MIWGYAGGKLVKGRTRHLATDTLGLLLSVVVTEANLGGRAGADLLGEQLVGRFPRLVKLFADSGYSGAELAARLAALGGWDLDTVRGREGQIGFEVQAKRWSVERTFGWLNQYRRLSKDYEELPATSEAVIHIAMIHLMLNRLDN